MTMDNENLTGADIVGDDLLRIGMVRKMKEPPQIAQKAQDAMDRQMRIQSLGPVGFVLLKDIYNAVELPPDLDARLLSILEFVEAKK